MKTFILTFTALLLAWSMQAATYTVTDPGDSPSAPTLRWAINKANANPGLDIIDFSVSAPLPIVIQLTTSLPKITDQIVIDGNSQGGTVAVGNRVVINGNTQQNPLVNAYLYVFYLSSDVASGSSASGSYIRNITIENLDHTPSSGGIIPGHQTYAFYFDGVDDCDIRNNILKDIDGNGMIFRNGADNNHLYGNIFGTDATLNGNHPVVKPITIGTTAHNIRNDGNIIGSLNANNRNFFYNMPANTAGYEVIEIYWGKFNRISGNQFVNNAAPKVSVDGMNAAWCMDIQECKIPPVSLQAELITTGLKVSGASFVQGMPAVGDTVEIFTSDATADDAIELLGFALVSSNGTWSITVPPMGVVVNDWVVLNTSNTNQSTSAFTKVQVFCNNSVPTISGINSSGSYTIDFQAGVSGCFTVTSSDLDGDNINLWSYDFSTVLPNGTFTATNNNTPNVTGTICWTPSIAQAGQSFCFNLNAADSLICGYDFFTQQFCINVIDTLGPCPNCIESFQPLEGKRYLVTAWAREANAPLSKTNYDQPEVYIDFPGYGTVGPFTPSGEIIDGWQRIEGVFTVPVGAGEFKLRLEANQGEVYFDDVRVLPFDAHMVNYVYDPQTMRLMAELDERHYATYYEYDEEGKLMRVKKETEKGIMTLQETRQNTPK